MYSAIVRYIQGENRPVYAILYSDGTVQVTGGTFTLTTNTDAPVLAGVPLSGADPPDTVVRVWYNLNTNGFAPGRYVGTFTINVIGADLVPRTEIIQILIYILAPS